MEFLLTILAIIACVLLFSFAVFIHEFGHFIAARRLGMRVNAFSIGFGPALWKKKYNGVEYRISAIPFGGYVSLPDLDPEGTLILEGESSPSRAQTASPSGGDGTPSSLRAANGGVAISESSPAPSAPLPPWKRIVVAFAGPCGNLVLAVVLAVVLAAIPGVRFGEMPAIIGEVPASGPAHAGGMLPGDKVVAVNGNAVSGWTQMQTEVQIAGGRPTAFEVERAGARQTLTITPRRDDASGAWFIMALSTTNHVKAAAWMPSRNPLKQLAWDASQIGRVLKALVTPREASSAAKALGGPVMIAEGLYRQIRRNVWEALGFLRFLNVNLAIVNLLPIPVLDGGLILFALFELLFRRKVPRKFVDSLSSVFMFLLLGLMLLLVYRDIDRSRKMRHAAAEYQRALDEEAARKSRAANFKPAFNLNPPASKSPATP